MVGSDTPLSWADDLPAAEQFDALMSLALDDTLRPDEEAEFERLLAEDPDLGDVWEEWQGFDFAFRTAPSVEPPADFVASFEDRLLKRERRRRLWLGAGVGAIAVVLWSSLAMGLAGAGAYVMFNQADWLTFAVRVVAQWTASVQSQLSMLAVRVDDCPVYAAGAGHGLCVHGLLSDGALVLGQVPSPQRGRAACCRGPRVVTLPQLAALSMKRLPFWGYQTQGLRPATCWQCGSSL